MINEENINIFDYSFLKTINMSVEFLNLTNIIYSLREKAEIKEKEYHDFLTNLQKKK